MLRVVMTMNFEDLIIPTRSLIEISLRGTFVYLFLFVLFRVFRREGGDLGISDLLVVVLVADASQNAMAIDYTSLTEGVVLVLTIVFWNYLLDFLSYRYSFFERLCNAPPLLIVKRGRMIRANMRKEMITEEELMRQIRLQGIESLSKVKKCYLEGDGHISIIAN